MASSSPTRFLEDGGDNSAMALKVWSGEVLTAFRTATVMWDRTQTRVISSGKSAQFPRYWKTTADYHTPGVEMLGNQIEEKEPIVVVDDELVAHVDVAKIDELRSHFDVRAPFMSELGVALAQKNDEHLMALLALVARKAADGSFPSGNLLATARTGPVGTAYAVSTTGSGRIQDDMGEIAQKMDEKDVPENPRFCVLTPYLHRVLLKDTNILSKDFTSTSGDINQRVVTKVQGFTVLKTNNLPDANLSATSSPSKYEADFSSSNPVALCWHPSALASVQLGGIDVGVQWDARRRTHFLSAAMAVGHDETRREAAGEIALA